MKRRLRDTHTHTKKEMASFCYNMKQPRHCSHQRMQRFVDANKSKAFRFGLTIIKALTRAISSAGELDARRLFIWPVNTADVQSRLTGCNNP